MEQVSHFYLRRSGAGKGLAMNNLKLNHSHIAFPSLNDQVQLKKKRYLFYTRVATEKTVLGSLTEGLGMCHSSEL